MSEGSHDGLGHAAAPTSNCPAVRPRIAQVGLLVEFVRVVPGTEQRCLLETPSSDSAIFLVLGEWDLVRLSLVTSLFPRVKNVIPWPHLTVPLRNQHSFVAHIWLEEDGSAPRPLARTAEGSWGFSEEFQSSDLPIALVICLKLHPNLAKRFGIQADAAVVRYIARKAAERGLLVLPAGSIGWQEVLFVVRAGTFEAARELVRDIYEIPVAELFPDVAEVSAYPLAARTITHPCVSLASYADPRSSRSLGESSCGAKLLLDVRPGVRSPLRDRERGVSATGEFQIGGVRCSVTELFGEYDFELRFAPSVRLLDILEAIRELRSTNSADWQGWLSGTAVVLDFDWRYEETAALGLVPYQPIDPPIKPESIKNSVDFFRWKGVENIHSERLLLILRRVASYSTDPVLTDSVYPIARYLASLLQEIQERRGLVAAYWEGEGEEPPTLEAEPEEVDQICAILEFSLRQRSEGLQQFLFNGLPSSYYGRGGLNRLLVGADAILQEVSGIFQIVNPGFAVFGLPALDGAASFGPIVIAPVPALFKLESWWILYHGACSHIDAQLFQIDFADDLVADIITLALPFRFDLALLGCMYAYHLATAEPSRVFDELPSFASRLGSLFVLQAMAQDLSGLFTSFPPPAQDLAPAWLAALERREGQLRGDAQFRLQVQGVIDSFLDHLRRFALPHHQRFVPQDMERLLETYEVDILDKLSGLCEDLRRFWQQAASDQQSAAFVALGDLVQALHDRAKEVSASPTWNGADLDLHAMRSHCIADLVYRAIRRWEQQSSRGPVRQPPPDIEDRLTEFLAVWHRGVSSL